VIEGIEIKKANIAEGKLDYLFNKNIKPDPHNTSRAAENAKQMRRIGLQDTPENRALLRQHFEGVVDDSTDIIRSLGAKTIRESFFMGEKGGVKFETVWEGERLITIEPHGGLKGIYKPGGS